MFWRAELPSHYPNGLVRGSLLRTVLVQVARSRCGWQRPQNPMGTRGGFLRS